MCYPLLIQTIFRLKSRVIRDYASGELRSKFSYFFEDLGGLRMYQLNLLSQHSTLHHYVLSISKSNHRFKYIDRLIIVFVLRVMNITKLVQGVVD